MKRQNAIDAFGSVVKLAQALGVTRQAIYQWPEDLPQDYADRVLGAAIRTGIPLVRLVADQEVCAAETAKAA